VRKDGAIEVVTDLLRRRGGWRWLCRIDEAFVDEPVEMGAEKVINLGEICVSTKMKLG
jgi:hypothetical protein